MCACVSACLHHIQLLFYIFEESGFGNITSCELTHSFLLVSWLGENCRVRTMLPKLVLRCNFFLPFLGGGPHNRGNPYSCVCLHGDRKPNERKANLQTFKDGGVRFLICTDVAARGIGNNSTLISGTFVVLHCSWLAKCNWQKHFKYVHYKSLFLLQWYLLFRV